jgi:ADP-heptose:LPS heptosyltransferase
MPYKTKILITRTDKLGDVILTLPMISEVKRIFPDSEISFLTRSFVKDLIEGYYSFDKLIILEELGGFFPFLKFLKKEKFDTVVNVFPRFNLALLFYLAGIKRRVGTGYRWYSFLFNKKLYEHRKHALKHESEYNIDLLKTITGRARYHSNYFFVYPDAEKLQLEQKLKMYNLSMSDKYIIVHAGSKGSAKDWSAENFKKYVNIFVREFVNVKVVLTGIAEEEQIIKNIYDSVPGENKKNVIRLSGKLNLKELMILIDNTVLFVSNSTGPIHIAGALKKNIIGFYPNQKPMNEKRWRPLSENAVILKPDEISDNMNGITPEKVISETKNFL